MFSFGSVLAFAAAGASPFAGGPGASAPSIMFRVVHGEPALDGVPGDLREIAAECLAKDPAQRPDLGQVAARSTAAWRFPASRQPSSPAVANGLVCFGSGTSPDGQVQFYAVSAKTGQQAWVHTTSMVSVSPQVVGGNLYMVDATGVLHAVTAATGNQVWSATGLQVDAGERNWDANSTRVAFAPGDGSVLLLDAATGKQIWKATSSSAAWRYVTLAGTGAVYAFDPDSGLLGALSLSSGNQLWSLQTGSTGSATGLFAGDGSVYLATQDSRVYCVDTTSRRLRWKYSVSGAGFPASDLVIAAGLVYFADDSNSLWAISAASGRQAWSYQVGGSAPGVAVANGYVYVPTENALQQLHAASGKPGWSYAPDGGAQFTTIPAVSGGLVFVGCDDNAMYAIRA